MATVSCPHCHQLVDSQAITCPHCRITLKAYGHPGITLHHANQDAYLCDSCTYHADNTCNFPQRPYAKECILYQNQAETQLEKQRYLNNTSHATIVKRWIQRYQAWLLLLGLLLLCLLIRLLTS